MTSIGIAYPPIGKVVISKFFPLENRSYEPESWFKLMLRYIKSYTIDVVMRKIQLLWFNVRMGLVPLTCRDRLSWASEMLDKFMFRNPDLRKLFESRLRHVRMINIARNHTHPKSAGIRSSVNDALKDLVTAAGYRPYSVSCSRSDKNDGCRHYYFIKDLKIPFSEDLITENTAFVMTDVDYYLDINRWLRYGRPILMYTMVPKTVTHKDDEVTWYFRDNRVYYAVSGGALYNHELWDYSGDTVCVVDDNQNLLTFDVCQMSIDRDLNRRVIMLLPVSKCPYPYWTFLDVNPDIKRLTVTQGRFNCIYDAHTDLLSIGVNGSNQSVSITARLYEVIRKRLYCKTSPPTIADIERILNNSKHENAVETAALLFNNFLDEPIQPNVTPTHSLTTYFQPTSPMVTEDGKKPGVILTSPLVTSPALFAARTFNSDYQCIKGRVIDVRNNIIPHNHCYRIYAEEFVKMVVPDGTSLTPYCVDIVRQRQSNPSQRARFGFVEASMSTTSVNRLAAFVKMEPYASPNHPRNITTCSPELTTLMSGFTYVFKDSILSNCNWYGPGKSPIEICNRLREVVSNNGSLQTDYARFDGSISEFLQNNVVRGTYLRAFRDSHRVELSNWINQVFMQRARTSSGQVYNPGFGTRSGSPITTDGNTLINAYIMYCALRKTGRNACESYNNLGIYCGDDGVSSRLDGIERTVNEVVSDLGLSIKTLVSERDAPIIYCGRVFCNIYLQNDSFQDPIRTIPKLHLGVNLSVTPEQAAFNKASGYLVTDAKTPLISDWARKVVQLCPGYKIIRADHQDDVKLGSPWPQDDMDLIRDIFCEFMQISSVELDIKQNMLAAVTQLHGFPIIIDNVSDAKIQADVGGEIVGDGPSLNVDHTELLMDFEIATPSEINSTEEQPIPESIRQNRNNNNNKNAKQQAAAGDVTYDVVSRHNANRNKPTGARSTDQKKQVRQRRPGSANRRSRTGAPVNRPVNKRTGTEGNK